MEQCNFDPLTTADGSKINLHHLKQGKIKWCAISRDLLYLFPKGEPKRIYIEGFGVYEVRDVMNKRFHHRVDILIHPKNSVRIKLDRVKIKILSSHRNVNRNHKKHQHVCPRHHYLHNRR